MLFYEMPRSLLVTTTANDKRQTTIGPVPEDRGARELQRYLTSPV